MIQRKKKGTNNGATRVATSIPPMTLVPMAWRLAAPAPVLTARGIYWLIVALHGITPEEIEDIPDAFGAAGDAAQPWPTPR